MDAVIVEVLLIQCQIIALFVKRRRREEGCDEQFRQVQTTSSHDIRAV